MKARAAISVVIVGVVSAMHAPTLVAALTPEESVTAGREGLDRNYISDFFPWYDDQRDAIRRIDVGPSWVESLVEWVRSLDLGRWFEWLAFDFSVFGHTFSVLEVLGLLLLATLIGLLIFVLVRIFLKHLNETELRGAHVAAPTDELGEAQIEALPLPVRQHVDSLLAEAQRLYQAGRYSEAIVYLFSHQLVELDRNHVIRLARGKTNRQYLREIGPRESLPALFQRTIVVFEEAFFGRYEIGRERFERCWSDLDAFHDLVRQGAAA
jgi:hypothetical protein